VSLNRDVTRSRVDYIRFDSSRDLTTDPLVSYKWASHVPTMVYNKGAAVIEMLDSVIDENRMRRLLRSYIRMNEFGSADTEIFLSLLNQTMNVRSFSTFFCFCFILYRMKHQWQ
jgi:hypothetical protein